MRMASIFCEDKSGSVAVEYGLMLSLVALTIVAAVILFGDAVNRLFQDAASKFPR